MAADDDLLEAETVASFQFELLDAAAPRRWSRPRRLDFFDRLPTAPVADTEILHLAHYCPLVVIEAETGPRVALLLDPRLSRSDPLDKEGRWRLPYCPMALRCLPFWPGRRANDIDVALDLVLQHPERGQSLHRDSGEPTPAFAAVVTLVQRLQRGMVRLGAAANMLAAADLLVPLMVDEPGSVSRAKRLLSVSPERLGSLSPSRAAALTVDHCLPLDLAAATAFSQRHLAPGVRPGRMADKPAPREPSAPSHSFDMVEAPTGVDVSPLFSFELFHRLEAKLNVA